MERERFKEYTEAAIEEKIKLKAIKSCFNELHTFFFSMRGDIFSSLVKTEEAARVGVT